VKKGQFIYSRLFAFEGAYGIVTEEYDGFFTSNEYPTFDCVNGHVLPEFLAAYFKAKPVWAEIAQGSKGLGGRRQRVHPAQILQHRAWLPPIEWQAKIAAAFRHAPALGSLESEVAAELDALLPSILSQAFSGKL
jgi:type I restriction enzyme S subunit